MTVLMIIIGFCILICLYLHIENSSLTEELCRAKEKLFVLEHRTDTPLDALLKLKLLEIISTEKTIPKIQERIRKELTTSRVITKKDLCNESNNNICEVNGLMVC